MDVDSRVGVGFAAGGVVAVAVAVAGFADGGAFEVEVAAAVGAAVAADEILALDGALVVGGSPAVDGFSVDDVLAFDDVPALDVALAVAGFEAGVVLAFEVGCIPAVATILALDGELGVDGGPAGGVLLAFDRALGVDCIPAVDAAATVGGDPAIAFGDVLALGVAAAVVGFAGGVVLAFDCALEVDGIPVTGAASFAGGGAFETETVAAARSAVAVDGFASGVAIAVGGDSAVVFDNVLALDVALAGDGFAGGVAATVGGDSAVMFDNVLPFDGFAVGDIGVCGRDVAVECASAAGAVPAVASLLPAPLGVTRSVGVVVFTVAGAFAVGVTRATELGRLSALFTATFAVGVTSLGAPAPGVAACTAGIVSGECISSEPWLRPLTALVGASGAVGIGPRGWRP